MMDIMPTSALRRIRDTRLGWFDVWALASIMCAGAMHGGVEQLGVGCGVRSGQLSRHVPAATPAQVVVLRPAGRAAAVLGCSPGTGRRGSVRLPR